MVDRSARNKVIGLLERALSGKITNWDFDDSWPESDDRVIQPMEEYLWTFYDDGSKYFLNIKEQKPDAVPLFERCIAFLNSDLEYEWPERTFRKKGLSYFKALFQKKAEQKSLYKFESAGDIEVWPFIKNQDFQRIRMSAV